MPEPNTAPQGHADDNKNQVIPDIEAVHTLSDDELDKALSKLEEADSEDVIIDPEPPADPDSANPPTDENKSQLEGKNEPEVKAEEPPKAPENAPPQDGQGDKDKQEVILDDTLLGTFTEEEQKYLTKFKGKPIREALKSYANAQKLVGRKGLTNITEDGQGQTSQQTEGVTPPPQVSKLSQEFESQRDKIVVGELKAAFPDLEIPADIKSKEFKEFVAELNYHEPLKFLEFAEKHKEIAQGVSEHLRKHQYVVENSLKINKDILVSERDLILKRLQDFGLDAKELGLNLEVNAEGEVEELIDVILTPEGNIKPHLVQKIGDKNILKKNEIAVEFFNQRLLNIINTVKTKAAQKAYEQAQQKKAPPSMIQPGNNSGVSKPITVSLDNIKNLTNEQLDAELAKLENID